jgi:hypothetical protein
VAELGQVPGQRRRTGPVLDADQWHPGHHRAFDGDQRHPPRLQQPERRVVLQPAGREHRRVQRQPAELGRGRSGPHRVAGQQQQADAELAELLGQAVQQLHGDRVAEGVEQPLADDGPDHAAAAGTQRGGDRVGSGVPELVGGAQHPLDRGRRDLGRAGEGQRGGGRGDPGPRGYRAQRRPVGHRAPSTWIESI